MNIMDEKLYVAEAMKTYGGGFVAGLGEALMHADQINARKVKETWPEYWVEYFRAGVLDAAEEDEAELNDETIAKLKRNVEQVNKGEVISTKEIRARLQEKKDGN